MDKKDIKNFTLEKLKKKSWLKSEHSRIEPDRYSLPSPYRKPHTSRNSPFLKAKCETLRKILVKKNIIEYENRDFTQKEALEILKFTERFYNWVVSRIK